MDSDCVSEVLSEKNMTMMSANFTYNFTQDALSDCDKTVFPSEEFFT